MFSGQIGGSRGQTRPAIDVHWFREILMLGALDHDLLANIAKRVRDRASRYVTTEHVAHVFPGRPVSRDISKIPKRYIICVENLNVSSERRTCTSVFFT